MINRFVHLVYFNQISLSAKVLGQDWSPKHGRLGNLFSVIVLFVGGKKSLNSLSHTWIWVGIQGGKKGSASRGEVGLGQEKEPVFSPDLGRL
jgi:hypothetical protein